MTFGRTAAGINKAEDIEGMDSQIGNDNLPTRFAEPLRRFSQATLSSHLQFHSWIRLETLCDRISVTFLSEATGR